MRRNAAFLFFVVQALLLGGANAQANDQPPLPTAPDAINDAEFHLAVDDETAGGIDTLIPLLRSADYHKRERATRELTEIGAPAFARLRSAFHATDDLEVRLRIEHIVMRAYMNRHVYHRFGFLGIRKNREPSPTHNNDVRIPEGNIGLTIERVIEDTGAARAGIEPGDIIIALNGSYLQGDDQTAWLTFAKTIRESGAGTVVTLTILRGNQELRIDATLGGAPRDGLNQIAGMRELYVAARKNLETWWFKYFRNLPTTP